MKPHAMLCVLGGVLLAVASVADAAATKVPEVEAKIRSITFPVDQKAPPEKYAYLKVNPNLKGRRDYKTEAVILENEYLRAVVLPEFGGRITHVVFKVKGRIKTVLRDFFWANDVLEDQLPWAMGGMRFSFPFYEHGRHLDETTGWRIVRGADGSATIAMDMRFSQYKGETQRYGRFSTLRLATYVTLRPGTALLEYVARIDNRLPLRHGFRLWSVAQFARASGAKVILPVGGVTGDGAPKLNPWPVWDDTDHRVLERWGTSSFGIEPQGDFCGIYYPQDDANHLILKPRYTAPGTKLYATEVASDASDAPSRGDQMVELWNGSNPLFEHPGHYLPPFGAYIMPLKLALVSGIGPIDWANDKVAMSYRVDDSGGVVRIVAFQTRPKCRVMVRTDAGTVKGGGTLRPDEPLEVRLSQAPKTTLVTVIDKDDNELAEATLPWQPPPAPEKTFQAVLSQMKPWNWLAMELSDWPREHQPNLADGVKAANEKLTSDKVAQLLAAARLAMRAEQPGSEAWRYVRSRLDVAAGRDTKHPYVPLYLGMMLCLEAGGKPTAESKRHVAAAGSLIAGQYLLALDALGADNRVGAVAKLKACTSQPPVLAMGLGQNALDGGDRLHPAALTGGQWPAMLRAAVLLELDRPAPAIAALEPLLVDDPARPEAMALLAEAYTKAKQTDKAQVARQNAERLFKGNEQAKRDYDALLKEAREGIWAGIPRP